MEQQGIGAARGLSAEGFFYENLLKMAAHCAEERGEGRLLAAYVLEKLFLDLAEELGDGPVISGRLREMEATYRTAVNLALERAASGATPEEQFSSLERLVGLLREHRY